MSREHLFLLFQAEMRMTVSVCTHPCYVHPESRKCYRERSIKFLDVLRDAVGLLLQRSASLSARRCPSEPLLSMKWARGNLSADTSSSPESLTTRSVAAALILSHTKRDMILCLRPGSYRSLTTHCTHTYEVAILTATFWGDTLLLRSLLQDFVTQNAKEFVATLQGSLLMACQLGFVEVAGELLAFGADSTYHHMASSRGRYESPLEAAIWWGRLDMVKLLLNQDRVGTPLDKSSTAYRERLTYMACGQRPETQNDEEMFQLLLQSCTYSESMDLKYELLREACKHGNIQILEMLLEQGLNPMSTPHDDSKEPPFPYAISNGEMTAMERILKYITRSSRNHADPINEHWPDAPYITLGLEHRHADIASKIVDACGDHHTINNMLGVAVRTANLALLEFALGGIMRVPNEMMESLLNVIAAKGWTLGLQAL